VSSKQADEADRLKAGTLPKDPKAETKPVAALVPRVLSVRDVLVASGNRALSREKVDTLTTGHYRLDKITGGFRPAFAWLVGADTSWGKSSFLISVCDENIRHGRKCLIVSSEDTEDTYGDRLMTRRSRVSAERYRDRKLDADEMRKVTTVMQAAEAKPFFVAAYGQEDDKGRGNEGWPIEDLLVHLAKLVKEQSIDFVAFDYLQEFTTKRRYQDERLKFKAMAGMMRRFIRTLKIRGVIFSQLTVTSETKIPNRHNIRECRDVANGADVILVGFEPDTDVKDRTGRTLVQAGEKCVHVDKVKNGPRGAKVPMSWDTHSACFNVVEDPEIERLKKIAGNDVYDIGEAPQSPEEWWDR
jgi:replicative DNA helicase